MYALFNFRFLIFAKLLAIAFWLILGAAATAPGQERQVQCFMLEFFYDSSDEASAKLKQAFLDYGEKRPGLKLHFRDVHENETGQKRLKEISDYFRAENVSLPAVYGLKNFASGIDSPKKLYDQLNKMLTMTAFVRNGCPHCRDAKAFLNKYADRYPALQIVYREVTTDPNASNDMKAIVRRYQQGAASLPVIHFCNGLSIGFNTESTTGRKILQTLDYWSEGCTIQKKN